MTPDCETHGSKRGPGRCSTQSFLTQEFVLVAGTANRPLAQAIASELGVQLGACTLDRFPDGEVSVRLLESVRRKDVYLVQPTSPPVNDHLMELMALADACRRAAAGRVIAIVPYFGYSRQDKRLGRREPITASLVAHLIKTAGVDHVITIDLHTPQIEGFFHGPMDSLTAVPTLCRVLGERLLPGTIVVAPDAGRVRMATKYARWLSTSLVVLHKQRQTATKTTVTHVVGEVRDRPCLLVDDIISTGGTIAESIKALLAAGARPHVNVAATHALLVNGAGDKLTHPAVADVFTTDTVAIDGDWLQRLHVVSVAPLLAETIRRLLTRGSLRDLV
jgi:ribose-phosphate pyrophosphokinase